MQLLVAGVDRGAVGGEELAPETLAVSSSQPRLFGRSAGGCRSRCALPAATRRVASRVGRVGERVLGARDTAAARPPPQTFTTSSGCEVGSTSERSSSETLPTASRIVVELRAEALHFLLGQLEAREARYVQDVLAGDGDRSILQLE